MPERFVPLAEFLRPVACDPQPQAAPPDEPAAVQPDDYDETLRAARRFRAASVMTSTTR